MNDLATIASRAAGKQLEFLVGGGHAVITHGHPRNTFDLDPEALSIRELFLKHGTEEFYEKVRKACRGE